MQDKFKREVTYLRVSVTERCNMRCFYCTPGEGDLPYHEGLPLEDLLRVVRVGTRVGIRKVRLTGGEPLVRRDIVPLVAGINEIAGIDDIAMTTNGCLFTQYAAALKKAGLKRVNISLDTLRRGRFKEITRVDKWNDVWKGIEAALSYGFNPVKLNMVVMKGINDDEIIDFAALTKLYPLHVRFIEMMPIGAGSKRADELLVTAAEIYTRLENVYGNLKPKGNVGGNGPARYWQIPGGKGTVGMISPLSGSFCPSCNRIRLTASGGLRPCLCNGEEFDLKPLLRKSSTGDQAIADLIAEAITQKPEGRGEGSFPTVTDKLMSQIGG
ncbi:MAG: GTP 3',8-cyclase MoaA [Peptococcaceae bacterium]|nr:GTP 3',8-cyclase MoaA [Peptococcaceae bacterium]